MSRVKAELGYKCFAKVEKRKLLGNFIYTKVLSIERSLEMLREELEKRKWTEAEYNDIRDIEDACAGIRAMLEEYPA